MQQALDGLDGVRQAEVDWQAGTARVVRVKGTAKTSDLIGKITQEGFEASASPRQSASQESTAVGSVPPGFEGLDAVLAAREKKIVVRKLLVPGKVTIVDFYAEWCVPCKVLDEKIKGLLRQNSDVALRKVDIVGWESPVARQCTEEFKMPALPYVRIYGKNGRFLTALGNDFEKIQAAVSKATK